MSTGRRKADGFYFEKPIPRKRASKSKSNPPRPPSLLHIINPGITDSVMNLESPSANNQPTVCENVSANSNPDENEPPISNVSENSNPDENEPPISNEDERRADHDKPDTTVYLKCLMALGFFVLPPVADAMNHQESITSIKKRIIDSYHQTATAQFNDEAEDDDNSVSESVASYTSVVSIFDKIGPKSDVKLVGDRRRLMQISDSFGYNRQQGRFSPNAPIDAPFTLAIERAVNILMRVESMFGQRLWSLDNLKIATIVSEGNTVVQQPHLDFCPGDGSNDLRNYFKWCRTNHASPLSMLHFPEGGQLILFPMCISDSEYYHVTSQGNFLSRYTPTQSVFCGQQRFLTARTKPLKAMVQAFRPGETLIFRQDLIHQGVGYKEECLRYFLYFDADGLARADDATYAVTVPLCQLLKKVVLEAFGAYVHPQYNEFIRMQHPPERSIPLTVEKKTRSKKFKASCDF